MSSRFCSRGFTRAYIAVGLDVFAVLKDLAPRLTWSRNRTRTSSLHGRVKLQGKCPRPATQRAARMRQNTEWSKRPAEAKRSGFTTNYNSCRSNECKETG
eukprot:4612860-Pleurochrysis_carterae.AAC.7